jgi:adhesin transport system membrane fusion protein
MARSLDDAARGAHWAIRAGVLAVSVLVAWAAFARIEQVTRAQGEVIPGRRTQVVQSAEGGVVTRLHVEEGAVVAAGDPLISLDDTRAAAAVEDSEAKVAALETALARLNAEVYGQPLVFPEALERDYADFVRNQRDLYLSRRRTLEESVAALEEVGDALRAELAMFAPLQARGDASEADVLRLKRQLAENAAEITSRHNSYLEEAQGELAQTQEALFEQEQLLKDRRQVLRQMSLEAPASGVIKNINLTTVGGVVKPGDVLMELLPTEDELIVEARVTPADIAFVRTGMRAMVKLDAYDYSIFGGYEGEVTYVSEGTLLEETAEGPRPYYRVLVRLVAPEFADGQGSRIRVMAGMTGLVEIAALQRSVLSYLVNPISKTLSTAFREL